MGYNIRQIIREKNLYLQFQTFSLFFITHIKGKVYDGM